jgi:2-polyprenyl-3-methyl-5-hydroxy-6-metoxy-1,4-benzoquinol methylase
MYNPGMNDQHAFGLDNYETYWKRRKERGRSGLTDIHRILVQLAERSARVGQSILDVGVGPGHVYKALLQKGYRMHGVEFADEAFALYDFPHDAIVKHDLQEGLPKQDGAPFQVIIASHIIHHMKDPVGLIRDLRSNMAPGSKLIIATQNISFVLYRLRYFFFGEFPDVSRGHRNFLTPYQYERILNEEGFALVERVTTGSHAILKRIAPYWFGATIFLVAELPKTGK